MMSYIPMQSRNVDELQAFKTKFQEIFLVIADPWASIRRLIATAETKTTET
jgi:hypothetical protein